MARKTRISEQIILQAALELLIEKGFSEVNIKTLSQKIGCSTQPIVWHFDNMEGLRIALGQYALTYANQKLCTASDDESNAFRGVGRAYIGLALNEPNLFRFLYMSGKSELSLLNFNGLLSDEGNAELIKALSKSSQISEVIAGRYLQDTIIYTHGIATLIAAGVISATEKEIFDWIDRVSDALLLKARSQ